MNHFLETILIIEDDAGLIELLKEIFKEHGYEASGVQSAAEAINYLEQRSPSLMVLDYGLPDMNGQEFIGQLQRRDLKAPPFIVLTGQGDERIAVNMMKLGARDYMVKDVHFLEILVEMIGRVEKELENEKKLKQAQNKITHLNAVLRAIRNVNQLIVREKYPHRLIEQACHLLTETRGYHHAWIALVDEAQAVTSVAEAGLDRTFNPMRDHLQQIQPVICMQQALARPGVITIKNTSDACPGCPLAGHYPDSSAISIRLEHGGTIYGVLTVTAPASYVNEEEEQALFEEVARDIALALHGIRLEEQRRQTEEKLRQINDQLQISIENMPNAYILWDRDLNVVEWNKAAEEIFGYSKQEMLGKNPVNYIVPKPVRHLVGDAIRKLEIGEVADYSEKDNNIRKDGRLISCRWFNTPLVDKNGDIFGILTLAQDITERWQTEESLRQLNQAMEQSPVSVIITDTEGTIQYVNPKFSQVTGYSAAEAIGQNPRLLQSGEQPPGFYREMWDTLTAGGEWQGEFHNRKKNGELYWELASIAGVKDQSGTITHYVAVKEDITQRKQLEEETVRQERLAAVGQLAAGIAHDFNNMLTTVMGYAELLQLEPNLTPSARSDLERIVKQSRRAAQLIRQILDFSRQTINEPQPLDLKVYLNETLKFIERTIPETIQIRFNFERSDHTINADPTQLQQVITNLAVNARDAMPHGGTLYFDLVRTSLAPDESPPCSDMETGEWIRLAVTDTGNGIAPEVLAHIFEPFFTTKKIGQGTGLGLAQIYGIVQQHTGCITVNSQVGQGATFTLYFPALTTPATAPGEAVEAISKGHGETILLVEDNRIVMEVTQAMLERLNYGVLTARDGAEALAVYLAQANQIALVLTDAVMPKMDGFALVSALRAETPDVKVVLMSGYARDSEITPELLQDITARLQKPISLQQLAQVMSEALG